MPLYEYVCTACRSRFERLRSMDSAGEDATCPDCGSRAPRALSVFASVGRGAAGQAEGMAGGDDYGYGGGNYACTPGLE